jgi:hypothetical protein
MGVPKRGGFSMACFMTTQFPQMKLFNAVLSHAVMSTKLKCDQKLIRTVMQNMYRTLQEHRDGHRALEVIRENRQREKAVFSRGISGLNLERS